jgi:hypothetical protein
VQNAFSARWDADIYTWHAADGSEAKLSVHAEHQEGCKLQAGSAAAIARYHLSGEIMQILVKRETSLADALDALTTVMLNALRAKYGERDEFSRFSEQVSRFPGSTERDRAVGSIPLPGSLAAKVQPRTVTDVEERPERVHRLATEVSEIIAKRRPNLGDGLDALNSTMLTAIEASCGRKRADEFDLLIGEFTKEVISGGRVQ